MYTDRQSDTTALVSLKYVVRHLLNIQNSKKLDKMRKKLLYMYFSFVLYKSNV